MTETTHAIACIGWGSLVHSPGSLPCNDDWRFDGPMLPVEFARESADGRITLVICPDAPRVQTCWIPLNVSSIEAGRHALGLREYPAAGAKWIQANIGFSNRSVGTSFGLEAGTISKWVEALGLKGAVWTNLPCKFNQVSGTLPSAEQVIDYLRSLQGGKRDAAEAYVRNAPAQIDTPYRRLIAQELGWTVLSRAEVEKAVELR